MTERERNIIDAIKKSGLYRTCYSNYEIEKLVIKAIKNFFNTIWIPCSEKMPEKDGHYIVYAPTYSGGSSSSKEHHDGIMFSAFKKGKWSIEHGYHKRPNCVVAWMPLPERYKAESEE